MAQTDIDLRNELLKKDNVIIHRNTAHLDKIMKTESKIQTQIKNKLTKAGWTVIKIIQLSENGYPDLLCLKNGKAAWIEVKKQGKEPEPLQKYRIQQLQKNGFIAFYADDPQNILIENLISEKL